MMDIFYGLLVLMAVISGGYSMWWFTMPRSAKDRFLAAQDAKYRRKHPPAPVEPSGAELLHRARAAFPADYLEWFDWQAEIAGFAPPVKPSTRRMADELDPQWRRANAQEVRLVKPEVVVPCGKGAADLCNPYYGVGTGWRHVRNPDGSHEWRSPA